ncbi:MAG TPA: ABC transporter family substrate-binding protein [Pseudonocardiaceae bacterium]|nr:ABC transporter family substrate-binding protein [Pseudonocardiaceae bacterium]
MSRGNQRNVAALLGVALAGVVTLAACGSSGTSAQNLHNVQQLAGKRSDINPKDPSTLADGSFVWPLDDWLPNWNGNEVDGNDENDVPVYSAIEPELFTIESDGTTQPNPDYLTSAKVTSTSPQTVTLDFNPKAHWTDGTPLSWQDVKAQWQALNGSNADFQAVTNQGYVDITSVTQGATPTEAVITFGQPFAEWQSLFTRLSPLYPRSVNATPTSFNTSLADGPPLVSAGPFKVQSFDKNKQTIVMVRNPDWWGTKPVLSKLIFQVVARDNRADAISNNEITWTPLFASADLYRQAQQMPNVAIREAVAANFNDVWFNGRPGALFSDVKLRIAVAKGINSDAITKAAIGTIEPNPVPIGDHLYTPGTKYHQDHTNLLSYNTNEAKKELDADGWTLPAGKQYRSRSGRELDVSILDSTDDDQTGLQENRLLIGQLAAIGVKATVNAVPDAQTSEMTDKGEWDIQSNGWLVSPFPVSRTSSHYVLNPNNMGSNYEQIGDAQINNLYQVANTTLDPTKRAALGNQIDTLLWQEAVDVPLFQSPGVAVVNKTVANFGAFGFGDVDYTKIGFIKQ